MARKITTAKIGEINKNLRFEPRYFVNRNSLSEIFTSFGYEIIDDVAKISSGSTPKHFDERRLETDSYFVKSADVKRYAINRKTISFVSKEIHKLRLKKLVKPNDVLVSNTGKYLGFASLVPADIEESTTNQNISVLRLYTTKELLTPEFLMVYLNSYFGQREIESLLTLTGQKYLNSSNFKKLRIPKIQVNQIESISLKIKSFYKKDAQAMSLLLQAQQLLYKYLSIDFANIAKPTTFSVNFSRFASDDLWTATYSYPLYIKTIEAIKSKFKIVKLGDIVFINKGDEVGSDVYIDYINKRNSDVPFIRTTDLVNCETDHYPDFFIPHEIYTELNQELQAGDILFTKDGKIGMSAMITENDNVIISSGIARLRINKYAENMGITSEYLFIILACKEIGLYQAKRSTVIASTIPHLREERLKEFEIPILKQEQMEEISTLVKEAFLLKNENKCLLVDVRNEMDYYFKL